MKRREKKGSKMAFRVTREMWEKLEARIKQKERDVIDLIDAWNSTIPGMYLKLYGEQPTELKSEAPAPLGYDRNGTECFADDGIADSDKYPFECAGVLLKESTTDYAVAIGTKGKVCIPWSRVILISRAKSEPATEQSFAQAYDLLWDILYWDFSDTFCPGCGAVDCDKTAEASSPCHFKRAWAYIETQKKFPRSVAAKPEPEPTTTSNAPERGCHNCGGKRFVGCKNAERFARKQGIPAGTKCQFWMPKPEADTPKPHCGNCGSYDTCGTGHLSLVNVCDCWTPKSAPQTSVVDELEEMRREVRDYNECAAPRIADRIKQLAEERKAERAKVEDKPIQVGVDFVNKGYSVVWLLQKAMEE